MSIKVRDRHVRLLAVLLAASGLAGASAVTARPVKASMSAKVELLTPKAKVGPASLLVRFVDGAGKPIAGAVVTAASLDMGPMGMSSMAATVKPPKVVRPGVYRFDTALQMSGKWAFKVAARAPSLKRPITTTFMLAVSE